MTQEGPSRWSNGPRRRVARAEHLAAHVMSVLKQRQATTEAGARQAVLDHLLRAVLLPGGFDPALQLDELRGFRVSVDQVVDTYIPLVAREVGEMWVASDVSFAQVTIAALRLQSILVEAVEDVSLRGASSPLDLSMLIVVPEGEQHFLGASVAATQLRQLGCHVATAFCEDTEMVVSRILADGPNAVLFSCGRSAGLATIAQTVLTIRKVVFGAPVLALGGAVPDDGEDLLKATGVDVVTNTVKDVVAICMKQNRALSRR